MTALIGRTEHIAETVIVPNPHHRSYSQSERVAETVTVPIVGHTEHIHLPLDDLKGYG